MKKALFQILLYLGIPAGFMLATGIPQTIYTWVHESHPLPSRAYTEAEFATLHITPENFFTYCDSIYEARKQSINTKGVYQPMDYFGDLKQLEMFRDKYLETLNNDRSKVHIVLAITNNTNALAAIRDDNWRKYPLVDRSKIDEARWYWFPAEKARDMETEKRCAQITWESTLVWFTGWFLRFYLRGIPTAFILFLFWKFKLKKDFDDEFKWDNVKPEMYFGVAPISFITSLVFWPAVLGIDIYNRFQETFRRADVISRRGRLLSLFSKQEEQLLELGKKMTRGEFKEYLDSIGMVRKHSFASALLVTVFLMIVPASLFPQKTSTVILKEKVVIMKSDYGGGGIPHHVFAKEVAIISYDEIMKPFDVLERIIFYMTDCLYKYLFVRDIGKVPLVLDRS